MKRGVVVLIAMLTLIAACNTPQQTEAQQPTPEPLQHGCADKNPACPADFACTNNTCSLITTPSPESHLVCEPGIKTQDCWQIGCAVRARTVCSQLNVIVKGPKDKASVIDEHAQILQKQYDFMKSYLGFEPTQQLIRDYTDDYLKYCPADAAGCSVDETSYWNMDESHWGDPWSPTDHELNHAFVFDILLDIDFDEAQARYMTAKESAHFEGYATLQDYLNTKGDYYYTPSESAWTFNEAPEIACQDAQAYDKRACRYLFLLEKHDGENLLPYLLKNAFFGKIELSTREAVEEQINRFVAAHPLPDENANKLNTNTKTITP